MTSSGTRRAADVSGAVEAANWVFFLLKLNKFRVKSDASRTMINDRFQN